MAKYLIQNLGDAIHPVSVRGETVDIAPGQGVIETLNQSEVKRLEHSVGLRLTLREDPAPVVEPASKSRSARRANSAKGSPAIELPPASAELANGVSEAEPAETRG